ncbi:cyclic nucleotide-binding domain-containing protein [candidate division KSB1 bacterium]
MKNLKDIVQNHTFFKDVKPEYIKMITSCSSSVQFEAGKMIFHEGEDAKDILIICEGKVAIELFAPKQGAVMIETIGRGDVLGWSWFIPPFRRQFDAKAIELTKGISIESGCLRKLCDEDNNLGYTIMQRFANVIVERLQATRLQLLDIYRLQ